MARRCITTWSAVLAMALMAMAAAAVPAAAVPDTCPVPGVDGIAVAITSPAAGSRVRDVVEVRGRAVSESEIFQVDLLVGDSRRDRMVVDPPARTVDFDLSWYAPAIASDIASNRTITVVACGGEAAGGRLVRGAAAVDLVVEEGDVIDPLDVTATAPSRDGLRPTRSWVGLAIVAPALLGLAYSLSTRSRAARAARRSAARAPAPGVAGSGLSGSGVPGSGAADTPVPGDPGPEAPGSGAQRSAPR